MSEGNTNPWWLCLRLIWCPDLLPVTAQAVRLHHAMFFGVINAYLFVGGWIARTSWKANAPSATTWWQAAIDIVDNVPMALIATTVLLAPLLIGLLFTHYSHPKSSQARVVSLASMTMIVPTMIWQMLAMGYDINHKVAYSGHDIPWLNHPGFAFAGSCFWLPGLVIIWCLIVVWGVRRVALLDASMRHMCDNCGYDLRGSIPAGATTCPECGTPIHADVIRSFNDKAPE